LPATSCLKQQRNNRTGWSSMHAIRSRCGDLMVRSTTTRKRNGEVLFAAITKPGTVCCSIWLMTPSSTTRLGHRMSLTKCCSNKYVIVQLHLHDDVGRHHHSLNLSYCSICAFFLHDRSKSHGRMTLQLFRALRNTIFWTSLARCSTSTSRR